MKKERFYLIDLFKLLGALCIVCIHTIATGGKSGTLYSFISKVIYGLPVPFFFVCSGFFLGNKILKDPKNIKEITINYIKRLLIPFIFWCLISSVFVFDFIGNYHSLSFWVEVLQKLLFSPWCAMWYVSSLIVAVIILYPFIKHKKTKSLIIFAIIMYLFSLLFGNYYFLIKNTFFAKIINIYKNIFITTRNGLFYGLPFVTMGYLIAKQRFEKKRINYNLYLLTAFISFITLIIEFFLLNKKASDNSSLYISSLILIPSFVFYLAKYKKKKPDFSSLAKYSTGIYFMHQFISYAYKYFFKIVGIKLFIAVVVTTIVLLTILYKVNNKYINKVIT